MLKIVLHFFSILLILAFIAAFFNSMNKTHEQISGTKNTFSFTWIIYNTGLYFVSFSFYFFITYFILSIQYISYYKYIIVFLAFIAGVITQITLTNYLKIFGRRILLLLKSYYILNYLFIQFIILFLFLGIIYPPLPFYFHPIPHFLIIFTSFTISFIISTAIIKKQTHLFDRSLPSENSFKIINHLRILFQHKAFLALLAILILVNFALNYQLFKKHKYIEDILSEKSTFLIIQFLSIIIFFISRNVRIFLRFLYPFILIGHLFYHLLNYIFWGTVYLFISIYSGIHFVLSKFLFFSYVIEGDDLFCLKCLKFSNLINSKIENGKIYCEHCNALLSKKTETKKVVIELGSIFKHKKKTYVLHNPNFNEHQSAIDFDEVFIDLNYTSNKQIQEMITHTLEFPPKDGLTNIKLNIKGNLENLDINVKNSLNNNFDDINEI